MAEMADSVMTLLDQVAKLNEKNSLLTEQSSQLTEQKSQVTEQLSLVNEQSARLQEENTALVQRVSDLERSVDLNSGNSCDSRTTRVLVVLDWIEAQKLRQPPEKTPGLLPTGQHRCGDVFQSDDVCPSYRHRHGDRHMSTGCYRASDERSIECRE